MTITPSGFEPRFASHISPRARGVITAGVTAFGCAVLASLDKSHGPTFVYQAATTAATFSAFSGLAVGFGRLQVLWDNRVQKIKDNPGSFPDISLDTAEAKQKKYNTLQAIGTLAATVSAVVFLASLIEGL